jgi:hypothetical protein
MSRILRRPMFRGGPVSSYGTGIAAPLVPGYEGGGQIGGGIIYGKPMADGRYGFALPAKQNLFDVKEAIGEIKVGGELSHLHAPNFQPIPTADEVAVDETVKINEVDTEPKDFEGKVGVNTTDEYVLKQIGRDPIPKLVKNEHYVPPYKTKTIKRKRGDGETIVKVPLDQAEIEDTKWDPGVDQAQHVPTNALLQDDSDEVVPELSAREMVEENKELFADLLGVKKARGQDISDMLLGWAGAEGDDTWSKTKEFFRTEKDRPGRAQKITDAAGTLAIQDYISGKRSKEQIELMKERETFKLDEQLKRLYPQADDEWIDALRKGAGKDGSFSSDSTLTKALAPRLREGPDKGKSLNTNVQKKNIAEISKDQDDFQIGLTIVTLTKKPNQGKKVIIEKTATDIFVREDLPVF